MDPCAACAKVGEEVNQKRKVAQVKAQNDLNLHKNDYEKYVRDNLAVEESVRGPSVKAARTRGPHRAASSIRSWAFSATSDVAVSCTATMKSMGDAKTSMTPDECEFEKAGLAKDA